MAADESIHVPSRITAVQICGKTKSEAGLESARQVLAEGNDTVLRLAGVAAIGDIGTEEDIETLEKILVSDKPLDKALHKAVKRSLNILRNK